MSLLYLLYEIMSQLYLVYEMMNLPYLVYEMMSLARGLMSLVVGSSMSWLVPGGLRIVPAFTIFPRPMMTYLMNNSVINTKTRRW
jgi:hypothetical protein